MSQENLIIKLQSLAQSGVVINFNSDELAKLLCDMYVADQQERKLGIQNGVMNVDIDTITYKLLQIIEPKLSTLDFKSEYQIKIFEKEEMRKMSHILWLLVQHQDHNIAFQQKMMTKYGDTFSPTDKTYLEDRIRANTSQPQIYGTQGITFLSKDRRYFQPIEGVVGSPSREEGVVFLTDGEINLINSRRAAKKYVNNSRIFQNSTRKMI